MKEVFESHYTGTFEEEWQEVSNEEVQALLGTTKSLMAEELAGDGAAGFSEEDVNVPDRIILQRLRKFYNQRRSSRAVKSGTPSKRRSKRKLQSINSLTSVSYYFLYVTQ